VRRRLAVKFVTIALTLVTSLAPPAHSQGLGSKGGGGASAYPAENLPPKVDEKAYKSALDRIPEPSKKYDPWGVARPPEPASAGKKSN
jgi:hypothetical protein